MSQVRGSYVNRTVELIGWPQERQYRIHYASLRGLEGQVRIFMGDTRGIYNVSTGVGVLGTTGRVIHGDRRWV